MNVFIPDMPVRELDYRDYRAVPTSKVQPQSVDFFGRLRGWQLTDEQVAAVLTYMRNSWDGAAPEVKPAEVTRLRSSLALRPD